MRIGIAFVPGVGLVLGILLVGALTVGLGFWTGVLAIAGGLIGMVLGAYWAYRATEQPDVVGSSLDIAVDAGDLGPEAVHLKGIITATVTDVEGYRSLIVELSSRLEIPELSIVADRIFVISHGMDVIRELFQEPERPAGLPILVDIYAIVVELPGPQVRFPKGLEFLGRGQADIP
ncbi:MAG: hypothetical protein GTO63_22810 [Anaerolineae bacterium]|nr:hypothetical protein [Anaerolineae bacterium]